MYDRKRGISGENLRHIDFVKNIAKPIFENWGYEVVVLQAEKDYLDVFNGIIDNPRKHMEHRGLKYGFCISGLCSVKRECKMKPINEFLKSIREPVMQYVGICFDEPKRIESLHKQENRISLLEKYQYTEEQAMSLCKDFHLLSPSYGLTKRNGCWFCPNAKLSEHRELRKTNPRLWNEFCGLENEPGIANNKWNAFTGETLKHREEILYWEDQQMTIFDFIK